MLSIVPLLAGGGLFETGAGGSAPKHVQQFLKENHLRWDSLGEFLALAVSLEDLAAKKNDPKIRVLSKAMDQANTQFLMENRSPSRKAGELDNRGSHFYLTLYWAKALADQDDDQELKDIFKPIAQSLDKEKETILEQMIAIQGRPVDVGGYYRPDEALMEQAMRPSPVFNQILSMLDA